MDEEELRLKCLELAVIRHASNPMRTDLEIEALASRFMSWVKNHAPRV